MEYPVSTRDRVPQTITCDPRITGYVDWKHSSCLRNRVDIVRRIELSPEEQAVSLEEIHYITRHRSTPLAQPIYGQGYNLARAEQLWRRLQAPVRYDGHCFRAVNCYRWRTLLNFPKYLCDVIVHGE